MARRPATPDLPPDDLVERIVDIDVATEMEGSFLEYAYSVIYSRALPDARDGLKPVQRRILFQMSDMGLRPDRPYVKSARVVGDVMGKLHPHGDTAIYDAMVRLAQPFSLRLPLVDGHGNFGSLDDGPAAPRYTEARMAPAAMAMTAGLDEDVVDFVPNYDNKLTQPEVLPAAIPNLLVNGAAGIAVGMATNMAPHNLVEVIAAARHLVQHPDATLEDLMRFVPGPDLPTGGKIVGLDGVRDAYRTGRGAFRTRATARIENVTPKRKGIVITELPYTVGPEKVIEKIKEGVQSKKLSGISDAVDLTDRAHGLRLVIEVKTGFNPEAVLEQLYRYTPLEDSFSINNVALVDGPAAHARPARAARRVGRAPARRRAPPLAVPARQAARAPAPRRGPARRDRRHRRGHPGHPHVRRRGHGARPPAQRLRPVRAAGRVHPRAAAAAPDEVLPHRAREGAGAAGRRDRRAARDPRRRRAAAHARVRRDGGGRRDLRHAAPHDPARVRRRRRRHRRTRRRLARPPRRSRSPTPRAGRCCPVRACSRAPRPRSPPAHAPTARRGKHDVARGGGRDHRARRDRRGHVAAAAWCASRCSTCPRCRRPTAPRRCRGGVPARRGRRARAGRARRRRSRRWPPTPRRSRSPPRRASSSASSPATCPATGTRGRSSRSRTATRSSAPRPSSDDDELVLVTLGRLAAALRRLGRAPAGPRRRRHGRHQARRRPARRRVRRRAGRAGRRTRSS